MNVPEVVLENSDEVYDFYLNHQQNRLKAKGAYAILARRYQPRVSYADGAREELRRLMTSGRRLLICMNHLSEYDPYTVAATGWRSEVRSRIGRIRVLAKDELFIEEELRRKIDMMGGLPVFRGKDHGMRAVNAAGQIMMDVCATRMSRGDDIALFPEGTCNTVEPTQVQAVGSGVGHIAFRAKKLGVTPALVFLGLSYGKDAKDPDKEAVKNASFHWHVPVIDELPTKPAEVTRLVRDGMQVALDGALAHY